MSQKMGCPFGEKPEGDYIGAMDEDDDVPNSASKALADNSEVQGLTWEEIQECYDNERWNK